MMRAGFLVAVFAFCSAETCSTGPCATDDDCTGGKKCVVIPAEPPLKVCGDPSKTPDFTSILAERRAKCLSEGHRTAGPKITQRIQVTNHLDCERVIILQRCIDCGSHVSVEPVRHEGKDCSEYLCGPYNRFGYRQ